MRSARIAAYSPAAGPACSPESQQERPHRARRRRRPDSPDVRQRAARSAVTRTRPVSCHLPNGPRPMARRHPCRGRPGPGAPGAHGLPSGSLLTLAGCAGCRASVTMDVHAQTSSARNLTGTHNGPEGCYGVLAQLMG